MTELNEKDLELIGAARRAITANYDGERYMHTVGAAVRAAGGKIYVGIDVYSIHGACAELVASIDDGEVVGVFDFSLTVGPSQSSEGFGTAWVTFPVDEKYDGSFVDVWTWRADTASYVSDSRHAVLRGTYPVSGGKVTVPFSSLTQVALSVQAQGSMMSM